MGWNPTPDQTCVAFVGALVVHSVGIGNFVRIVPQRRAPLPTATRDPSRDRKAALDKNKKQKTALNSV